MGLKFNEFCRRIATKTPIIISDSMDIPDKYTVAVNELIKDIKPKRDILDKISIPYVEPIFDGSYDIDIVDELDTKLDDGEIPDGIINKLSKGIFYKMAKELTDEQQVIIKVLAVYICIQN